MTITNKLEVIEVNKPFESEILNYKNVGKYDKELETMVSSICLRSFEKKCKSYKQNEFIIEKDYELKDLAGRISKTNEQEQVDEVCKTTVEIWENIFKSCSEKSFRMKGQDIYNSTLEILYHANKQDFAEKIYMVSPYHREPRIVKAKSIDGKEIGDALECHGLTHISACLQFDHFTKEYWNSKPFYLITGKNIHGKYELGKMKTVVTNHIQKKHSFIEITECEKNEGMVIFKLKDDVKPGCNPYVKEFVPSKPLLKIK